MALQSLFIRGWKQLSAYLLPYMCPIEWCIEPDFHSRGVRLYAFMWVAIRWGSSEFPRFFLASL